ncbi:MAG: AMIN-like domain-containing (lipo)protein, partial [Gemmatimonadales bacterium]
ALHRAARATRDSGFDRLVFEFSGDTLPGYQVAYATDSIRHCGSGDPVSLTGTGFLVVRFEPAQAHDGQGRPTITDREWAPELPAVKQLKLVCDFEGQVEWAVGLAGARRYRVIEAAAPARVIVDVRHRD